MRRLRPSQTTVLGIAEDEIGDRDDWEAKLEYRDDRYEYFEEDDSDEIEIDTLKVSSPTKGCGVSMSLYRGYRKEEWKWMTMQEVREEVSSYIEKF